MYWPTIQCFIIDRDLCALTSGLTMDFAAPVTSSKGAVGTTSWAATSPPKEGLSSATGSASSSFQ